VAADATRQPLSSLKRSLLLPLLRFVIPTIGFFSASVTAETVVNIPRENGALLQEFKNLLREQISQFDNGIGRIELEGNSGKKKCIANFYTNEDSTFLTIEVPSKKSYKEFYIDHPTQSFKPILFQKLILSDSGTEIKVVKRRFTFSIKSNGQTLTITTKSKSKRDKSPTCTFELVDINLYEGETE